MRKRHIILLDEANILIQDFQILFIRKVSNSLRCISFTFLYMQFILFGSQYLISTGFDIKIAEFHRWYFKCSGIAWNSQIFNNLTTRKPCTCQPEFIINFSLQGEIDSYGYEIQNIGNTFIAPLSLFSDKISSVDELKDGDVIAIPNDLTNGGRALKVLESAGIITLDPNAGFNPTVDDIQTYNVGVTIKELKANVIVSTLPDVTAAIVNNNYALDFGLAASDAIFADDRLDIEDYWNLIAARTADLSDPAKVEVFRKVVEAYQSDETLAVYNDQCKGFYTPAGWDQDLLPQA